MLGLDTRVTISPAPDFECGIVRTRWRWHYGIKNWVRCHWCMGIVRTIETIDGKRL